MSSLPCPICAKKSSVSDTRLKGEHIRRRYVCESGHRFGTIEVVTQDGMPTEKAVEAFQRMLVSSRMAELKQKLHAAVDNILGEVK